MSHHILADKKSSFYNIAKRRRLMGVIKNNAEKECPNCKDGPEAYRMFFDLFKFDVELFRVIQKSFVTVANEFAAEFDRLIIFERFAQSYDSSADAVSGFQNCNFKTFLHEFKSG